jgi:hypothetical protein
MVEGNLKVIRIKLLCLINRIVNNYNTYSL